MNQSCLLILDVSGSMEEEGKKAAAKYTSRAIRNFIEVNFQSVTVEPYLWGSHVVPSKDTSVAKTKLNPQALAEFVKAHLEQSIIVITDGNLSRREALQLKSLSEHDHLSVVMIGADANKLVLSMVVQEHQLFEAMDAVECTRLLFIDHQI